MAEGLLAARLGDQDLEVYSAGVAALVGESADPMAVSVAGRTGIDISNHVARQLIEPMAVGSDLILAAEQGQVEWVQQRFPVVRGRTFRLGHWRKSDIEDPFRQDEMAFERAFADIQACVDDWLGRMG